MWDINKPREMELAKAWTRNMLALLKEGGMWGVPRSESCYQFWQSAKEYKVVVGSGEASINRVLAALGYKEKKQ